MPVCRTVEFATYSHSMSADLIVYCLESVSDFRSVERLCSTFLADGDYPGIDPLGGTGDGGRDAIVRTDASGRRINFAYTGVTGSESSGTTATVLWKRYLFGFLGLKPVCGYCVDAREPDLRAFSR